MYTITVFYCRLSKRVYFVRLFFCYIFAHSELDIISQATSSSLFFCLNIQGVRSSFSKIKLVERLETAISGVTLKIRNANHLWRDMSHS